MVEELGSARILTIDDDNDDEDDADADADADADDDDDDDDDDAHPCWGTRSQATDTSTVPACPFLAFRSRM